MRDRGDEGFDRELARRAVESIDTDLHGALVLDLGSGPGHSSRELEARGARAVAGDMAVDQLEAATHRPRLAFVGDARRLPLPDAAFDGVFCSNVLEHTPEPFAVIDEIDRVLTAGGWAYLSWTNWLSPWGGHAIAPFHYLGAERGLRVYRRLLGEPRGKNLPFDGVWPVHIGEVLRYLSDRTRLRVDTVEPRYYPRLRALMRIPGLREIAAWNCVIRLTKAKARVVASETVERRRAGS